MAVIEVLDHHIVYENPRPQNRARHGYFPGLVQLPSGELWPCSFLAKRSRRPT